MHNQILRLLSYNIQAGLSTSRYSHYLTNSWKQVLPVPSRMENLDGIGALIEGYDIVGVQEVDAGSLRSGFVNQAQYLAQVGHFRYVFDQPNRSIGRISQHSNGLFSHWRPSLVEDHKLPGVIPGRGALRVQFGEGDHVLNVFVLHLALGKRGRLRQIDFLADLIAHYHHVIVMGDFNCRSDSEEMAFLMKRANLREPEPGLKTFPSWKPDRQLDHILVSPTIEVIKVKALGDQFSDHLPIMMEVSVPQNVVGSAAEFQGRTA